MELDIVAAGNDLQRVELEVLDGAHRLLRAFQPAPAPTGPYPLLAKDETTGCLEVNGQHG
ncbi:MAG TPA: hypothetical protein VJ830_04315 [Anaerolineales bacterium]|nr:hypothetical protein [Anaerolineales bacterium]